VNLKNQQRLADYVGKPEVQSRAAVKLSTLLSTPLNKKAATVLAALTVYSLGLLCD
jgi:hypothetical protein